MSHWTRAIVESDTHNKNQSTVSSLAVWLPSVWKLFGCNTRIFFTQEMIVRKSHSRQQGILIFRTHIMYSYERFHSIQSPTPCSLVSREMTTLNFCYMGTSQYILAVVPPGCVLPKQIVCDDTSDAVQNDYGFKEKGFNLQGGLGDLPTRRLRART